jgi:hypothetical protein
MHGTTTVWKSWRTYEWGRPKVGDEMRESASIALVPRLWASLMWLQNESLKSSMTPRSFVLSEAWMVMPAKETGRGR